VILGGGSDAHSTNLDPTCSCRGGRRKGRVGHSRS